MMTTWGLLFGVLLGWPVIERVLDKFFPRTWP